MTGFLIGMLVVVVTIVLGTILVVGLMIQAMP